MTASPQLFSISPRHHLCCTRLPQSAVGTLWGGVMMAREPEKQDLCTASSPACREKGLPSPDSWWLREGRKLALWVWFLVAQPCISRRLRTHYTWAAQTRLSGLLFFFKDMELGSGKGEFGGR